MLEPVRAASLLVAAAKTVLVRRMLGDVAGHPFHGNQYTGGEFGTRDPFVYHISDPRIPLSSFEQQGIKPSKTGIGGPGVYMAHTPEKTQYYHELKNGRLFRIDKKKLIEKFGTYPASKTGVEYDDDTGEVILSGGRSIPREFIEVKTKSGWRALGDVEGHPFHGNQYIDVEGFNETKTYSLSEATTALQDDHDFVWENDLLPSLDGLRPAGISDTENARKAGAAERLNKLAKKHGITAGFAIEIRDKGRLVGLATVARARVNDKDYPDFIKAAADYMGERGLSVPQERTLGKWLGFSKKSTDAFLKHKAEWQSRRSSEFRVDGDVEGHPFHGNQWTGGGYAELAKLEAKYGELIPQNAIFSHYDIDHEAISIYNDGIDTSHKGIVENVRLRDLYATQDEVDASGLRHYVDGTGRGAEEVIILRFGGRDYIVEGHHRAGAAILQGKSTIKAEVYDAGKLLNLGDVEGHPFHGNQWTGGKEGDETWKREDRTLEVLNGVPFKEEQNPDFTQSVNPNIDEPPFPDIPKGKHPAAGVVVTEPDGRVWLVQPWKRYGGYRNTFPKGTLDKSEHPQEAAAREVWEETGLVVQITGHLADVERTTSVTRFYEGKRIGGAPWAHGKETYAVRLMPIAGKGIENALKSVFGHHTPDHKVLDALRKSHTRQLEFNPDQPRDEHGQWTDTGGGGNWPSGLKNISGAKGSNPGGLYKDSTGQKWYVKRYNDPRQAATEQISNEIYRAVGVDAPHSVLGEGGDYASKIIPSDGTLAEVGLTRERADKILDGFAADVFLDNWDAVGTGHDNILVHGDKVTRVDQGGTLLFRAQGALKPEAGLEKIDEWNSLVEKNHYYAQVFKAAGIKNGDALGDRAAKQIDRIVKARPAGGWKELIDHVAPKADPKFRERVAQVLEKRQTLLEKKRDELRGKKVSRAAEASQSKKALIERLKEWLKRKNKEAARKRGARALAFNPDQPRDDQGQWSDGGGGDVASKVDSLKDVSPVGIREGEDSAKDAKDRALNPLVPDYAYLDEDSNIDELTDEIMESIAEQYSSEVIMEMTEATKEAKGVVQSIAIDNIDSPQTTVSRETIRKYISTHGWEKEAAIGIKENGRVLLVDGNHRVAALKMRGEKTANIRIINAKLRGAGDVEGHPFHGNQWTDELSSTAELSSSEKRLVERWSDRGRLTSTETLRLQKIIDKQEPLKAPMIVYRGVSDEDIRVPGEKWRSEGFTSTSRDRSVAARYGDGRVIAIKIPKGTRVLDTEKHGWFGSGEVILSRNTRFVGEGDKRWRVASAIELKTSGDVEGHPFHGNQWTSGEGLPNDGEISQAGLDKRFPVVPSDDTDVPNMSSISASLTDYEILDGIREVKMSEFEDDGKPSFYSITEEKRVKDLAERMRASGKITPLIVVVDADKRGPYILEGGHRFDALKLIGRKSFPALVVVDTENLRLAEFNPDQPRDESGKWSSTGGFLSKGGERVTGFHGTPDSSLTVADLDPGAAIEVGGATFFTLDEDTAWQYTHQREYGEIVGESSENVLKAQFRMTNPMVVDMEGEVGEAIKLGKLVREAKEKGHDGLILENIDDTVDSSAGRHSNHVTIAVFKKDQIVPGEGQLNLLEFNPDQPRDDSGKWTDGGGGTTAGLLRDTVAIVRRRSETIASNMGVPSSIIQVVDKEPREFIVGNQQFKEAGHYDPSTGMIEINARNSYSDRMSITNGIAAHEVSHAIYDAARRAQSLEHEEISNLPSEEYNRLYRMSGYARPEMQQEILERWPVSAMFYRHIGDSFMETEAEQQGTSLYVRRAEQLQKDDGVSEYSKSYWDPKAVNQSGGFERAVNETLAETTRHQVSPLSWSGDQPHNTWSSFAADLQKIVQRNKVKAQMGKRG